MTASRFAGTGTTEALTGTADYQPGVCNIGPAEIARRRRAGHVGLVAGLGLLVALVAIDAPPIARIVVALPAAVSASGYLQARLRFCAGFGSRGVFNFGDVGPTEQVVDDEARRRDRDRARQIGLASGLIGLAIGVAAVMLPTSDPCEASRRAGGGRSAGELGSAQGRRHRPALAHLHGRGCRAVRADLGRSQSAPFRRAVRPPDTARRVSSSRAG